LRQRQNSYQKKRNQRNNDKSAMRASKKESTRTDPKPRAKKISATPVVDEIEAKNLPEKKKSKK
jgi:hypothetical protein